MKNSLITGASRGFGYCLTEAYLRKGYRVFAGVRGENTGRLPALKSEYGDQLIYVSMDMADSAQVKAAAEQVKQMTTSLDIIVCNAAIHATDSFEVLEEVNVDNCLEVYNINSLGPLRVAKEFLPLLEQSEHGVLVNISSETGSIGDCWRHKEFDYCMSKTALNMESKLLQNYLGERGIKVLAVHPGWMRTDMGGPNATSSPEEAAEKLMKVIEQHGDVKDPVIFVDNDGNQMNY